MLAALITVMGNLPIGPQAEEDAKTTWRRGSLETNWGAPREVLEPISSLGRWAATGARPWSAMPMGPGVPHSVSWWPITAVAWGAHLGSIGSLIVYFGDPLNTVVRHGGLLLRIAFPECGVPAWAPGELL